MTEVPPPRKRKPITRRVLARIGGRVLVGVGLALLLALVCFPERHRACAQCQVIAANPWRWARIPVPGPDGAVVNYKIRRPIYAKGKKFATPARPADGFRINESFPGCECSRARHPDPGEWYDWAIRRLNPPKPAALAAPAPAAGPTGGGLGGWPPGR